MTKGDASAFDKFQGQSDFDALSRMLESAVGTNPQLSSLLEVIATTFQSYGCIMWEANSDTHLSMLGCWFPTDAGSFAIHDLPIDGSVSGKAHATNSAKRVENVQEKGGPKRDHPFLVTNNIGPLISVPVIFQDNRRGTLDLLRQVGDEIYTSHDERRLEAFARIAPAAYQAVLDRRSYNLVRDIEEIIRGLSPDDLVSDPQASVPTGFDRICSRISKSFHAIETSLFLLNPLEDQEHFIKRASTWQGAFERDKYHLRKDALTTKTGWIIAKAVPVLIFDLNRDDPDSAEIQQRYPGIKWNRFDGFIHDVIRFLNLPEHASVPSEKREDVPPLSYIAAPILRDDEVVGVIRCCGSRSTEPGFFSDRDLGLLQVVAGQISRLWTTHLSSQETKRSAEMLTRLADAVQDINSGVHRQLAGNSSDLGNRDKLLNQVLDGSLAALAKVVPKATAIDMRQLYVDEENRTGELRFSRFFGSGWTQGGADKRPHIAANFRFPVDSDGAADTSRSLGEKVVRMKKAFADDAERQPNFFQLRKDIMPACRHTFCAPIIAGDKIYGVLDILTEQRNPFTKQAEIATEVVGSQLALYLSLFDKIDELEALKSEVDGTYEDLGHQLKGPVSQAYFRAKDLLQVIKDHRVPREIDISALRGLCAKSLTVMHTLSFISGSSKVKMEKVELELIKKLFVEAAWDYERANQDSETTYYLDAMSWASCPVRRVSVDRLLLPQVVSVVCDNAMKYSFEKTSVEISVGALAGKLQLTIASTGLPITSDEVSMAVLRGWRGKKARAVTAEGRGIGLFLCARIMDAMGGELRIEPTDKKHVTRIKLVFTG